MKKSKFTLVEIIMVMSISLILVVMVLNVVIALSSVFRDGSADFALTESAHLVRQKILRSFGLRQAIWDGIEVSETSMEYKAFSPYGEWPELDEVSDSTQLQFYRKNQKIVFNSDLNDDKDLRLRGITIRDVNFQLIPKKPADKSSVNQVQVNVLFEMNMNGETYVMEEQVKVSPLI